MCGILGVAGNEAFRISADAFSRALDRLVHRGPDDRGVFEGDGMLLGHRRLSILDLSTAGRQPMIDPESGMVIVYNGEIYNYIELREELEENGHRFRTRTDTEVLLACYRQWGPKCLGRLNGMWAFAIWSPDERTVFMARDRFGIKPFYYYQDPRGALCFASEPKSILHLFPQTRSVDTDTLYEFLALGLLYRSQASFYRGIKLLPPAHYAVFSTDTSRFALTRYWRYPDRAPVDSSTGQDAEEFLNLFDDAVSVRLRSDVPVGITLSGGIDSTAVLAGMHKAINRNIACYTSVYDGGQRGEARWAAIASEGYGDPLYAVEARKDQWLGTLRRIAWHMDAPGYSPAVFPLWYIMQAARKDGVIVLLEGQGADEAFGGYPQYGILSLIEQFTTAVRALSPRRAAECKTIASALMATFTPKWVALWLAREFAPFLVHLNRRAVGAVSTLRREVFAGAAAACRPHTDPAPAYDRMTQRLFEDHALSILPGLLHYGDAVSMAHSVESRLPFMDYRLVEYIFSRGPEIKVNQGVTKWVIREYLKRRGQTRIAGRKDKLGYPTPVEQWLAENNGAMAREALLGGQCAIHQFCDPVKIARLIDKHVAGRQGVGNHLYRLLSTELWLKECFAAQ